MEEKQIEKGKSKKSRKKLIVTLVILLVLFAAGGTFVFIQYQKPKKALEEFLEACKVLDYDTMGTRVKAADLSVIEDSDLGDEAYQDFFKKVNEHMTYEIEGMDFKGKTATVTAKIKYADGSGVYKNVISQYLKKIVGTAFSGQEMSEEDNQELLGAVLDENSGELGSTFSEIIIDYPMEKLGKNWVITQLDNNTVTFLSANFSSVKEELNSQEAGSETGTVEMENAVTETSKIDLETEKFSVKYKSHKTGTDYDGNQCLLVYYDYTNLGEEASSPMVNVTLKAYQNKEQLEVAIPSNNEEAIDNFTKEITPKTTVTVCQAFALKDTSNVTLELSESFSFGEGQTTGQILKLTK